MEQTDLSKGLIKYLWEKGIGGDWERIDNNEGHSRQVYRTDFKSGNIKNKVVVKVSNKEVDDNITSKINHSKCNVHQNEASIVGDISKHDNIIDILFHFPYNGHDIIVEEDFKGQSLKSFINSFGKITSREKIYDIFSKVFNGVKSLNINDYIAHRDIKSSNILINSKGDVKITDFQLAKKFDDIEKGFYPTRGGTMYTHPELLNALFSKWGGKANTRSEVYALTMTFAESLIGNPPVAYKIVKDENGKEILAGEETQKISLEVNGKKVDKINEDEHEKIVKDIVHQIPKPYKKFVKKGLTLNYELGFKDVQEMKKEFDKIGNSKMSNIYHKIMENMPNSLKVAAGTLAMSAVFATLIYFTANREPNPEFKEIMGVEKYKEFTLEPNSIANNETLQMQLAYISPKVLNDLEKLEKNDEQIGVTKESLEETVNKISNYYRLDERLVRAWLYSSYFQDKEEMTEAYDGKRTWPTYPEKYLRIAENSSYPGYDPSNPEINTKVGAHRLKVLHQEGQDFIETLAKYYIPESDRIKAQINTGASTYLVKNAENPMELNGSKYRSAFIRNEHKEATDEAILLYFIQDENGNFDKDKLEFLNKRRTGIQGEYWSK